MDTITNNIEWAPGADAISATFADALLYVYSYDSGDGERWRMPTIEECMTTPRGYITWTSETDDDTVLIVDLYGRPATAPKTRIFKAWPVRNLQ